MSKHTFVAQLVRSENVGTWTYVDMPFDAIVAFGNKGQNKVK